MSSRSFAILNPNAKGAGLALDYGNTVVTTDTDGLDLTSQRVHGTIPKAVGHAFYEMFFWSESRGDLTGLLSVGVAEADSALNMKVGEDAQSFGLWPAEGGIYSNGILVAAGQPVGERACISVYLRMLGSAGTYLVFFVEGSLYAGFFITDGKFWVPAIGIGSAVAGDVSAFFNSGQRAFENQPVGTNS